MLIKERKEDKFECCFIELHLKVIIIHSKIKHISRKKQRMRILGACISSKFFLAGELQIFYMHLY